MKRNTLTLVVGTILLLIFFILLFTFQVRQTEVVLVTTFSKPSAEPITQPGLYFKWPMPIQKVYRFDKRVHSLEDEFEQILTRDGNNILASIYVGWTIAKPREFFNAFPAGTPQAAEPQLKGAVRLAKQAIISGHAFSDFVSSDPKEVKFTQIEKEMYDNIKQAALDRYGIDVQFVGIKRLGLPESVTQKVFDRMTQERQREIERVKSEGEKEAVRIRSTAERERNKLLDVAKGEATRIRGAADAEAANSFEILKQEPNLAIFLMKLRALEASLNKGATIIGDTRMQPFDLLLPSESPRENNSSTNSSTGGERLSANGQ